MTLNTTVVFLGIEPGVTGLSLTTLVLWHLGYPDQALRKSDAACPGPRVVYQFSVPSPGLLLLCCASSAGKS
jgi:hypothetical protein